MQIDATLLEFLVAAAGAGVVASDFGTFAADGLYGRGLGFGCRRLCRIVQIPGVRFRGALDGFEVEFDFGFGFRRGGGFFDDVLDGFHADARRGVGGREEMVELLVGEVDEFEGSFAVVEGAFVERVVDGIAEAEVRGSPVGDGVAVDAGGVRRGGHGDAR